MAHNGLRFNTGHFHCENCGKVCIGQNHCATGKAGRRVTRFCDDCADIGQALAIGARLPVFLYEGSEGAVSWTGARLGTIVNKTMPPLIRGTRTMRKFGAVHFRVRMLDGSTWYGTGPVSNGNYLRLRPMKGE